MTLVVSKHRAQNTVAAADAVKERLEEVQATLPKDVQIQIINDQSMFIEARSHSLEAHLIEGSLLAAVIVFIFLANIRTTLIAAIAIPTSIISTFALMGAMGFTLNQITMLALTLMVGIVIDDAIIVLENIYRFIEEKGMSPDQAAIEGTKEIGLAVMATTLSLLAVFMPVGFMGGIVGRFMSSFGLTAAFAIAVSLLVSFTLTPMLTSRFVKVPPNREGEKTKDRKESRFFRSSMAITRACSNGPWRIARPWWRSAWPGIEQRSAIHVDKQELYSGGRPVGVPSQRSRARGNQALAATVTVAGARRRRVACLP